MTALDLIDRALRNIQVLGDGQTASAAIATEALATLNDILDSWKLGGYVAFTVSALTDEIPDYEGYRLALRLTLQEHLATSYEQPVSPLMMRHAAQARHSLWRSMQSYDVSRMPEPVRYLDNCRDGFNIITGEL